MTPILDQITSPATAVAVACRLLWRRTYQNNDALHDEREATAEDVRRWLDAQTAEYRDEALLPFRGPGVEAWKNLCDEYANDRDSLKSQLSAAVAELSAVSAILTDEAIQHDTHKGGPLPLVEKAKRALEGWQDRSDAEDRAQTELSAARETIREHAAANTELMTVNGRHAETIRALTEERDFFDAERIKVVEELTAREAPGEEWKRACRAQRADDESKRCECDGGRGFALVPYEPPRSEEGNRDVKPDNVATRLAPLTDRETEILDAAQVWHAAYDFADIAEMPEDAALWRAVDLPKTPDVPPSRYSQQTKDAHGAVILAGLDPPMPREKDGPEYTLAECPWCGPNGDPEVLDPESEDTPDESSENAVVVCGTCMAHGPGVAAGCHDADEDGPLLPALIGAAVAAWNERLQPPPSGGG